MSGSVSLALLAMMAGNTATSTLPAAAHPVATATSGTLVEHTIIQNRAAAERLRGNSGITLQWIDWDNRGSLTVQQPGDTIFLNGEQKATSGTGSLTLKGHVLQIDARQFHFRGRIIISDTPDVGRQCVRDGDFTFAITQKRQYWRLQQMEMCDGLTDYIDIYF